MATIEHVMPIDIRPLDGSGEGVTRPGLEVSTFQTGYHSSRDWFEYNLRTYSWNLSRMAASSTKLAQFRAFLNHTRLGGGKCWIREALSSLNHEVVISPVGNGSRTTFVLPFFGTVQPSDLVVTVAGKVNIDYSVTSKANLLTDAQANAVGGTTGMIAYGTCAIAQAEYPVADGLTSFLVNPTGTVANYGIETDSSDRIGASSGDVLSFMVAVWGSGDYELNGVWYNSGGSVITTIDDTATIAQGGWNILQVSGAAPATTIEAGIRIRKTSSSDENFYAACFAIAPGDLDKWFLPSEAPMTIEFDTAPGSRERVLAHGTGVRTTLCRMQAGRGADWRMASPGDAYRMQFSAMEELE